MRNVNLTHSEELIGFDCSLMVNLIRKLPLFVDFSLGNVEDVPHSLVTTHNWLIFLYQPFYSFQH